MTIQRCFVLLWAVVALGCATSPSEKAAQGHAVSIRVENDLIPPSDVTIWLRTGDGASVLLGGAPPGRRRAFEFRERLLSGNFQFIATTGDGRTIRSRQFTLFPGSAVRWRMQRNMLEVLGVG